MIANTAHACTVSEAAGEVIDFAAHKAERLQRRFDGAAYGAGAALSALEAGHGSWNDLAALLVRPFNV